MYTRTFDGPYVPYPNASAVHNAVDGVHHAEKEAVAYISAGWRNTRNATEYIGHVKEWRIAHKIDGIYSHALPKGDFVSAYKEVRMLRELFPSGPLTFHDTLDGYPSTFRPLLHAYGTAILTADGVGDTNNYVPTSHKDVP